MTLPSGARLGPYVIVSPLGAGGMGEVYKGARHRLDRIVAIKVLSEQLASDPQFRERFEREARSVGSLNHPHICTLHDVGRHEDVDFLVMEYLEGETLQERLRQGAIPVDRGPADCDSDRGRARRRASCRRRPSRFEAGQHHADEVGRQAARLRARQADAPAVAGTLSMLPTTPPGLTAQGTIVGTFQYMAPEQLEGKEADARTDIFAFGSTLYEMLHRPEGVRGPEPGEPDRRHPERYAASCIGDAAARADSRSTGSLRSVWPSTPTTGGTQHTM